MLKNDEVDYCTKCTAKPIVKEHMCEECYADHCQWLRELSAPKRERCGLDGSRQTLRTYRFINGDESLRAPARRN